MLRRFLIFGPFFREYPLWIDLVCSPMQIKLYDIYIYLIVMEGLEVAFNFIQILSFCSAVALTGGKFLTFLLQTITNYSQKLATNKSDEISPNHLLQEKSVLWGWKTFQIVLYAQGNAEF